MWLVIPLIGLTVWRLMTQKQWSRAREAKAAKSPGNAVPGLDSEFFLIEQRLTQRGWDRREGETLAAWLARLRREEAFHPVELPSLLTLHYRLRFDPAGLNAAERRALQRDAAEWLERDARSEVPTNGRKKAQEAQ
jgi:hypothetical protein